MPPDAIASSDFETAARSSGVDSSPTPRCSASARSRSSAIVDGNFGAAPSPPHSGSNVPAIASMAAGTTASPGAAAAGVNRADWASA
jgi:hypothetical protein